MSGWQAVTRIDVNGSWVFDLATTRADFSIFSSRTGFAKTTLYSWENGGVAVPFDKAVMVFEALGYEVQLVMLDV